MIKIDTDPKMSLFENLWKVGAEIFKYANVIKTWIVLTGIVMLSVEVFNQFIIGYCMIYPLYEASRSTFIIEKIRYIYETLLWFVFKLV